jgi:hypothetical protein
MREMREMKKYFLLPLLLLPLLTLPLATYAHSYPVTKQLKQSVNIPKKGLPGRRRKVELKTLVFVLDQETFVIFKLHIRAL